MSRYLLASDLQLGCGETLGRVPGERLAEQETVWAWIVAKANELNVPLVFLGDAWERRRPTPAELLAFFRPLEALNRDALIISGNHDQEGFDRPTGYDVRPGHQHLTRPDIICMDGAIFCCLPWAPPGRLVALEGGGDRDDLNDRLARGLVEIARGLFTQAGNLITETGRDDMPVVLLAHWHFDTAVGAEFFREPVLPYLEVADIGFDAILAGHHHTPQRLGERGLICGSPMPCSFGEAGYEHVVWLIDVEPGRFDATPIPVPSRRLVTVDLTAEQAIDVTEAQWNDHRFNVKDAVVKIRIAATKDEARRINVAGIKGEAEVTGGAHKVWAVQVDIERADVAVGVTLAEDLTDQDALTEWLALNVEGEDQVAELFDIGTGYIDAVAA